MSTKFTIMVIYKNCKFESSKFRIPHAKIRKTGARKIRSPNCWKFYRKNSRVSLNILSGYNFEFASASAAQRKEGVNETLPYFIRAKGNFRISSKPLLGLYSYTPLGSFLHTNETPSHPSEHCFHNLNLPLHFNEPIEGGIWRYEAAKAILPC